MDNNQDIFSLDKTITDPAERVKIVEDILAKTPSEKLTPYILTVLSNYIIFTMDKQERLQNYIITKNHKQTIMKREVSLERFAENVANKRSNWDRDKISSDDILYEFAVNDKNILFTPRDPITQEDIDTIPGLKEMVESINKLVKLIKEKKANGEKYGVLYKQLLDLRHDQYELRAMYKKPIRMLNLKKSICHLDLSEKITENEDGLPQSTGVINLYNPTHISLLLTNYSRIKQECWDNFESDTHWIMEDLDNLIEKTFKKDFPLYYDLIIYKIDGKSNAEIQNRLAIDYNIRHTPEYISALWCNKIPKMIAETASKEWLVWHYTVEERGKWKKCSKCGQIKLAHNEFFSKNNTSKDGFYSMCKECRKKNYQAKKMKPKGV